MSRLIDADKINPNDVFIGNSDFAIDIRNSVQLLINNQPTAIEWILCSDRLPEQTGKRYLCADNDNYVGIVCYEHFRNGNQWMSGMYTRHNIIAWQPLPEPYTENRKES